MRKHFASPTPTATPSPPPIVLAGVPRAPDDVVQALQASIDATDAASSAEAVFQAVLAKKAANVTGDATFRDLKAFVLNQFKTAPDTLADFGMSLPSRRVPTAATVAWRGRQAQRDAKGPSHDGQAPEGEREGNGLDRSRHAARRRRHDDARDDAGDPGADRDGIEARQLTG